MSDILIGLLLSVGVAGWVYNKINIRTGHNNTQSIATAAIAGILAFLAMITVLQFVPG